MMFQQDANSVDLAIWLADLLDAMYRPDSQDVIDRAFRAEITGPLASTFQPDTAYTPRFYYGQAGGQTLFLMGYTASASMGNAFFDGYGTQLFGGAFPEFNWMVDRGLPVIDQLIAGNHFQEEGRALYAGYSLGGCFAQTRSIKRYIAGARPQPVAITFGSPRCLGPTQSEQFTDAISCRWMNNDDPIPLLPPKTFPLATIATLGNPLLLRRYLQFSHARGGILLSLNGRATAGTLPPLGVLPLIAALGGFMHSQCTLATTPHNLAQYRSRLALHKSLNPLPSEDDVRGGTWEGPDVPSRVEMNQQAAEATRSIFATGARQNEQPVDIPSQNSFRAFRLGHVWQVQFNGAIVAVGPTKKRARALANAGNAMLRQLQISAVVDTVAILNMFELYLQLSADPTEGFVPVLNTAWPQ